MMSEEDCSERDMVKIRATKRHLEHRERRSNNGRYRTAFIEVLMTKRFRSNPSPILSCPNYTHKLMILVTPTHTCITA